MMQATSAATLMVPTSVQWKVFVGLLHNSLLSAEQTGMNEAHTHMHTRANDSSAKDLTLALKL